MLNLLSNIIKHKKSYSNSHYNNITDTLTYFEYLIAYNTFYPVAKNLQKKFLAIYVSYLQRNRLNFNLLPTTLKNIFIFFDDVNANTSYSSLLNYNYSVHKLRELKYPQIHKFFVVQTLQNLNYYNELNPAKQDGTEIANFYYTTRIQNLGVNKNVAIVLYFFNKLLTTNQPYFYWLYRVINTGALTTVFAKQSYNVKSFYFYIYINSLLLNVVNNNVTTYVKVTLTSFKGIRTAIKLLTNSENTITSKHISVEAHTIEQPQVSSFMKNNFLINYLDYIQLKITNYNLRTLHFTTNTITDALKNMLPITWYNKVHNSVNNIQKLNVILYLRASKHFNKGRYSRNRQLYRTGVYWCIWLNILVVYGLHYYFYRIVFSFGYLWLPLGIMILAMFGSRLYKYRFYSITQLRIEFLEYLNFLYFFFLKFRTIVIEKSTQISGGLITNVQNYTHIMYNTIDTSISNLKDFIKKIL